MTETLERALPYLPDSTPVTELERARQHLFRRQDGLRRARAMGIRPGRELIDSAMRRIEADYLAALSWVWDAQERAEVSMVVIPNYAGPPFMCRCTTGLISAET